MATKKNFSEAAAMEFISTESGTAAEREERAVQAQREPTPEEIAAAMKAGAPEGYKLNPLYIEKKSRRVTILMQPSLFEKVKNNAEDARQNISEYIINLIEKSINQ